MHARLADAVRLLTRPWRGTATEMLARLRLPRGVVDPRWPATPWALSTALRAIRPALRARRVSVRFRHSTGGVRHILVTSGRDEVEERVPKVDLDTAQAVTALPLPWSGTTPELWEALETRPSSLRSANHLGRVLRRRNAVWGLVGLTLRFTQSRGGRRVMIRRRGIDLA